MFMNTILVSTLAVLAAAAPLSKRWTPNPDLHVAVTLYAWPGNGAWDSSYKSFAANPKTTFDVVINPSNGPLADLDDGLLAGIRKLQSHSNVRVYGYFKTGFAKRDFGDVQDDIATYVSWQKRYNIFLTGYFVDEAPNYLGTRDDPEIQTDDDVNRYLNYMKDVRGATTGSMIWTNPGCTVDAKFYDQADTVTAYEGSYDAWVDPSRHAIPEHLHAKSCVIINNYDGLSADAAAQALILITRGFHSGMVWGSDYQAIPNVWSAFADSCSGNSGAY